MKIFQLLIKEEIFNKGIYSSEIRKAFWNWHSPYFTSGLRIEGDEVLIPGGTYLRTNQANLLIFAEKLSYSNPKNQLIEQPSSSQVFENIRLITEKDKVHVHTNFSKWRFSEVPLAENHKIAELMPGESLRFMANDRYDFSAAARKQRRYVLFDYLLHYTGQAKKIRYTDSIKPEPLMIKEWKEVDERKIMK